MSEDIPQTPHRILFAPPSPLQRSFSSSSTTVDFSAFLSDDFDIKSWINRSLAAGNHRSRSPFVTSSHHHRSQNDAEIPDGDDTEANDVLMAGLVDTTQDVKVFDDAYARSPTSNTDLSLEQHATMLVTKLQILSQEVSQRLAHTTDVAVKSMPRTLYDLQLMKEDALSTKAGVEAVRNDLSRVENDTSRALERLKQLDLVKNRMEACRAALREAENWSNLESEASRIFAAGDHDRAAVRLQDARRSLNVFQNTPEYEQRRALLERLQNELERAVRPQLVQALVDHDAVACHKYFVIFDRIQRTSDFMDCYFDSRKEPLVNMWREQTLLEDSNVGLIQLAQFYQECFVVLNEEYAWCGSIFPDPRSTIQSLVRALFSSLVPTVSTRLAVVVDRYGEECLPHIITAFAATEKFGSSLERVFARPTVTAAPETSTTTTTSTNTTTASTTATHRKIPHLPMTSLRAHDDPHTWAYILYDPFHEFQRDYAAYERTYLSNQLTSALRPPDAATSTAIEPAKQLTDAVTRVFALAEASIGRCADLTHGFAGAGLVVTLNGYFEDVARGFGEVLKRVRVDCGLDEDPKEAGKKAGGVVPGGKGKVATKDRHSMDWRPMDRRSMDRRSTDRRSMDRGDDSDFDFDFDENELDNGDWSNFQAALRLLATCRGMAARLAALEDRTRKALAVTRALVDEGAVDGDDDEYFPAADRPRRESVIPRLERRESLVAPLSPRHTRRESLVRSDSGSIAALTIANVGAGSATGSVHTNAHVNAAPKASLSLLRQSALNSYDLGRLLSALDQPDQSLLPRASAALHEFTRACQRFVFDTVHLPIARHLAGVGTMTTVWTADDASTSGGDRAGRNPFNLEIPQFSLSPSEYITKIGEQLLMLPQQFEVYAVDRDALAFEVEGLPFADEAPAVAVGEQQQAEILAQDATKFVGEREHDPSTVDVSVHVPLSPFLPSRGSRVASTTPMTARPAASSLLTLTPEEVTHLWYTSLSRGTMHALLDQILSIPSLSPQGARQLAADIGYLINVLAALEIEPVPDLARVHRVLGMDDTEVFRRLRNRAGEDGGRRREDDEQFESEEARALLKKVAGMMGIQLMEI
ncbi:Golgi complex component 7-domain-containing protein [Endogone sp. FLAS-F59071]|nr:Golgi complex component 7-domain-containing protein [Endogone sp. FLAS-F59071]|eukprot:RUS20640.1 Golgi complex component 7-domain-containing protein [Endogone sp. FLAS-F59071]